MAQPADNASRILQLLRDGPQTAQTLATRLDVDVSSVRRHLGGLAHRGWTIHDDRVEGPGRPRRHYALSDAGWESFPRHYAFLLDAVLAQVGEQAGRDAVLAAFAAIAGDLADGLPKHPSVPERLEALRRLYEGLGFEASVENDGGKTCIVQRNCPFLKTAKADPEGLCDCLDEGIMRRVLPEARIELGACMATGDTLCRHTIHLERPPRTARRPGSRQ